MTMRALSRRNVFTSAAVLLGSLAFLGLQRQGDPPSEQWVRDRLWGDDLLAYAVWDGQPRAVLEMGHRVAYDLMIPGDWFWPEWPPRPQWQLMGLGYSIAASNAPATVGYAPCVGFMGERCAQSTELFGQINVDDIVALDVWVGDSWQRFPVAAPGFVVRLAGVAGAPSGYRWLDPAERVVWETPAASPTTPGAHGARRRRARRKAAPVP